MTPRASFSFGTKAETLQALAPLVTRAVVPELLSFTVAEWHAGRQDVLARIGAKFGAALLAVRSSALSEDGLHSSNAGAYDSKLHVRCDDPGAVVEAVEAVVASMSGNPRDQVLVQAMVSDVAVGGVIMTYDLVHGDVADHRLHQHLVARVAAHGSDHRLHGLDHGA
ncbi:MAG: sugar metabolism cluster protein, partial [Comamonadaceae bacterium]